ncbi:MAG: hemerythrin family protein [Thiohalocapsa sp.]
MSINWENTLATGIERIDAEHRVFVALISDLDQADAEGAPRERMERILREVQAYALFHFTREENLMLDQGYPDYERHRREHQNLLAHFTGVLHEYREGRVLVQHIVELTYQWFAGHATEADQRLAEYLRGATPQALS